MTSVAIDYTYSYPFASEVCADEEKSLVRLSTYDDKGSPHFFNSGIAEPAVFADALICISTIVRSHFFERKVGLLDPVVTCGQSRLRFEGFSGCCGVYLQCNFDDSAFSSPIQGRGTTNIDFNEQFVQGLAQTRFAESAQLSVGANDVTLGVGGRVIKEKKVKLPLRWLKGFCEVQSYLTNAELQFTIPAVEVLRFIRGLPRSAGRTQTLWLTAAGKTLRLTTKTGKGTVPVVGTERLRAIEPLVRISKKPVEIWHARGVTTWKIVLTGCTFVATFSPEIYRGFSGEGQALQSLATGDWKNALQHSDADVQSLALDGLLKLRSSITAELRTAIEEQLDFLAIAIRPQAKKLLDELDSSSEAAPVESSTKKSKTSNTQAKQSLFGTDRNIPEKRNRSSFKEIQGRRRG